MRRLVCGRAVAALAHELVEFRAILGRAQAIEIVVELALLLVELAQRLHAIFVEGDVARALVPAAAAAPARAALERAPLVARGTAGVATFGRGPVTPRTIMATTKTEHASAPFQVNEKGKADWPEHDEAQHHQGDPGGAGDVVQSLHKVAHAGPPDM